MQSEWQPGKIQSHLVLSSTKGVGFVFCAMHCSPVKAVIVLHVISAVDTAQFSWEAKDCLLLDICMSEQS